MSCIQQAGDCESTVARQQSFSLIYSVVYLESILVPQECTRKVVPQECTRKVTPWHATADIEGRQKYRSNPFAMSALESGVCLSLQSGRFTPGKTRWQLNGRLVGTQDRSWRARKIRPTAIPSLNLPALPYVDYCMPAASRQECIASNVWMKDVEKRR